MTDRVVIVRPEPKRVVVRAAGARGPRGVDGAPGPAGGAYTHTQVNPNAVWTIQHNLGYKPIPFVADPDGTPVLGWTPTWASDNVLILTFPQPRSGTCQVT